MLDNGLFHEVGHAMCLTTRVAVISRLPVTYLANSLIPLYESPTIRPEHRAAVHGSQFRPQEVHAEPL